MKLISNFKELLSKDTYIAGGKGASLGEMTQAGIPVPPGFVILSGAFEKFLEETDLNVEIEAALNDVNHNEIHTVENASQKIQALILDAEIPKDIADEIQKFFKQLDAKYVAVRSSATAEDSASAAWAGQLDSFLNTTEKDLLEKVKRCWASLFTPRAIFYRFEKELHKQKISVAVVVQKMVESEVSGIAFSVHPVTQDRNQLIIEAGFGLGEAIVSGQITPDSYVVGKKPRKIIDKNIAVQTRGIYRTGWKEISKEKGENQALADKQILTLSNLILKIENHYGFPCDIEWAFEKEKFYIVQSRPITTLKIIDKNINNNKEGKWHFRVRREATVFPAFGVTESLAHTNTGLDIPFNYSNARYINYEWLFSATENQELENILSGVLKKDINYFFRIVKKQYTTGKSLKKYINEIIKKNYTKKALVQEYKRYIKKMHHFYSMWWLAVPAGNLLEQEVRMILKKRNLSDYFNNLTFPSRKLDVSQERIDMLNLGIMIGKTSFDNVSHSLKKKLEIHAKKYGWISCTYHIGQPLTAKDVHKRILMEDPKLGLKMIRESEKQQKTSLLKVRKLLKPNEFLFVKAMQEIIFYRNYQKDTVNKCQNESEPFLKKIAETLNLKWVNFLSSTPYEVEKGLNSATSLPSKTKLKNRRKSFAIILENGDCFVIENSKKYMVSLEDREDYSVSKDLRGNPACRGLGKGRVRIIRDKKELALFKRGEILVTSMTTPDFVPIMKIASAIVTDEGGITCHAAIVSRELNVPCVIGTNKATQVLKNGNLVEVDANNGTVKILK